MFDYDKLKQREYHKKWAQNKAQISIRIPTDFKDEIDRHTKNRNETIANFVVRAMKEQIVHDKLSNS